MMLYRKDSKRNIYIYIKIKKMLGLVLFVSLFWEVFKCCTYLFRNADFAGRAFVLDFRSEKKDTIDVVYVGASSVYCYFDPMMVWGNYGITSYCYAVADMDAAVMLSSIKDVYKSQSPQLIICDARRFLSSCWNDTITMGARNILDSFDLGLDRLAAVEYFREIHGLTIIEAIPELIDLSYYHTNYNALASPANWSLANNKLSNIERPNYIFKGYRPSSPNGVTSYFRDYDVSLSVDRKPLLPQSEKCLNDLINFCKEKEINLLLVASPYIIQTNNDQREMNTVADIALRHSVTFLNYNTPEMYDELKLDFTADIFDCNHVNCLGAQKFTENIANYINNHYSFEDHRRDECYLEWEKEYNEQYLFYMDNQTNEMIEKADSIKTTMEKERVIHSTKDVSEWLSLIRDPNITILLSFNAQVKDEIDAYNLCFDSSEDISASACECIGVITNEDIMIYPATKIFSSSFDMPLGVPKIEYTISRNDSKSLISVNEKTYDNNWEGGGTRCPCK